MLEANNILLINYNFPKTIAQIIMAVMALYQPGKDGTRGFESHLRSVEVQSSGESMN